MRRLVVFNNVSLDGYFVDANGDISWAHKQDPEWSSFVSENASGTAVLAEVRHDAHKKWSNPLRISSRSRRVYTTLAVETEAVRKADAQQVEKRFLLSGGLCDPAQSDFAAVCGGQNDVAAVQFG